MIVFRDGSRYSVAGQTGRTNQVRHLEVDGLVSKMASEDLEVLMWQPEN